MRETIASRTKRMVPELRDGESLPPAPKPLRLPLLMAVTAVAMTAAVLLIPANVPAWWAVPVTAAAAMLSQLRVMNLPFGKQRWSFAWEEVPVAIALLAAPGSWVVCSTAVGVGVAQALRKQPRVKQLFNTIQLPASVCVSTAVMIAVGDVIGVVLAMAAFYVTNSLQVTLAIWTTTDRPFLQVLVDGAPLTMLHSATNTSIAVLAYWIATANPYGLLALIAPVGLLVWAIVDVIARTGETQLLAELVRAHESRVSDTTDEVVGALLHVGSRLVPGVEIELIVFTPEGPHLYRRQTRGGVACHRMRVGDFAESWALAAASDDPVSLKTEAGAEALLRVGRRRHALGLVRMYTVERGRTLGREEFHVLRMLARHAEASLSVDRALLSRDEAVGRANAAAETVRSLGDLSADTSPALRTLRESASRLASMAVDAPFNQFEVTRLVQELYAVERAVASLCGAVTLAAEPGLEVGMDLETAPRPAERAEAWTRTGILEAI